MPRGPKKAFQGLCFTPKLPHNPFLTSSLTGAIMRQFTCYATVYLLCDSLLGCYYCDSLLG